MRENTSNLIRVFFCNELIETGLGLEQRGLERQVGAIARMQVEFGSGRVRVLEIEVKTAENRSVQATRNQRGGGCLAAADEEFASVTICGNGIG